jgi:hypothetical protein
LPNGASLTHSLFLSGDGVATLIRYLWIKPLPPKKPTTFTLHTLRLEKIPVDQNQKSYRKGRAYFLSRWIQSIAQKICFFFGAIGGETQPIDPPNHPWL